MLDDPAHAGRARGTGLEHEQAADIERAGPEIHHAREQVLALQGTAGELGRRRARQGGTTQEDEAESDDAPSPTSCARLRRDSRPRRFVQGCAEYRRIQRPRQGARDDSSKNVDRKLSGPGGRREGPRESACRIPLEVRPEIRTHSGNTAGPGSQISASWIGSTSRAELQFMLPCDPGRGSCHFVNGHVPACDSKIFRSGTSGPPRAGTGSNTARRQRRSSPSTDRTTSPPNRS